ncbi:MAG: glycosyltransferase family 4 protein [Rhodothermales bacterium]
MKPSPHIMLFDLFAGGHHGQYMRYLVEYWGTHRLPGRLSIVAPPAFFDLHADVQHAAASFADAGTACIPTDESITLESAGALSLLRNDRTHGRLARKYITRLRPDHCVFMYFDQIQLSLASDLTFPFPVQLSGIYFRPSFHYPQATSTPPGLKERLKNLRKRMLLPAALRNRHFTHLFCLDPYVVPHVASLRSRVEAVALPDGVAPLPPPASRSEMRARWGVEANRKVALFFGSIEARKGIHQTLEALCLLPPEAHEKLCLVMVGSIPETEKEPVRTGIRHVREKTNAQVVVEHRFVEEEEIQGILEASDLVLLPYQRHVGSSGVLIRAALASVPVLGSDYGLVGEQLRSRSLGLAIDTTVPSAVATGIERWLADPDRFPFDAEAARRFATENTAERFAATLFRHVAMPLQTT